MNAFRLAARQTFYTAIRRAQSNAAAGVSQGVHHLSAQSAVPSQKLMRSFQKGFKANSLSDPSTYPLFLFTGVALAWTVGMGAHNLFYNKDVRIAREEALRASNLGI